MEESLFLNTLAFEFPKEPKIFYFSKEDRKDVSLTKLSHQLFPINIKDIFPDIKNSDTIYTSFDRNVANLLPLGIDFTAPENYNLVKRHYNRKLNYFLVCQNLIVEPNRITKDNQVWILCNTDNRRKDCDRYDRFTLKFDFDHFNKRAQIVLSYDRGGLILKSSITDFLKTDNDPFTISLKPAPSIGLINRVLFKQLVEKEDGHSYTKFRIDRHLFLEDKAKEYNTENSFPIMNYKLANYLGINEEESNDDSESQYVYIRPKNRYLKYYNKINQFFKRYLDNDEFRSIIPISKDGFSYANKLQIGNTKDKSKELIFGDKRINVNPQAGVNNGPFAQAKPSNIQLLFIFPKADVDQARLLLGYLKDGYKDFFKGLKKYTGKEVTHAPSKFHVQLENPNDPIPEIEKMLQEEREDRELIAIYLTPISKHSADKEAHKIYYKVKEKLLVNNIVSQCIETDKMLRVLKEDEGVDKNGNPKKNFSYTLQNIAIAINAKLGGTPWRLNAPVQNELVVGIGAFKNIENNTNYIGSAFSFDNTGSFNAFEYFQRDQLKELAGSVENAIKNFTRINDKPERLIIHYYKEMSLIHEFPHIENKLNNLGLDIPVYVVTVNKTESEDFLVFDGKNKDLLPYSGRYINLGNKTYLLCNNTRYENAVHNFMDGYPFPVKIKIECPTDTTQPIDTKIVTELIDQVYQFSRIYWKSVKQQNLPVTIKYPEMIAQILPYFSNTDNIDTNNLWFL